MTHAGVDFVERQYFVVLTPQVKCIYADFAKYRQKNHKKYHQLLDQYSVSSFFMVDVAPNKLPVRFNACTTKEYDGLCCMKELTCFEQQNFKVEVTKTSNIFLSGITILMWSAKDTSYTKKHTFSVQEV